MRQGSRGRRAPANTCIDETRMLCHPIPNIATITSPNGANPVKLVMTWRSSQRMPLRTQQALHPYFFSSLRFAARSAIDIEYP